ncbi:Nudix (Nucleoside diphosphate linked moiety X)-type motif 1 [Actinomortierella wolfii]|nr:Nudix (Nucleoside diphosphate linked moiety X)-type motif 1 [Actinomortierella wolfii]
MTQDSSFDQLRINKLFTLIFIHDVHNHKILLGEKQRGPLTGQWNGFGGKVEKGESIAASAARELMEEAGIQAPLFLIGEIQWAVTSAGRKSGDTIDPSSTYRDIMFVFKAHTFSSEDGLGPVVTEEMAPGWWSVDKMPWDKMRKNHQVWYKLMLSNLPFRGLYWYNVSSQGDAAANTASATSSIRTQGPPQVEYTKETWTEDVDRRQIQYGTQRVRPEWYAPEDQEYYAQLDLARSPDNMVNGIHPTHGLEAQARPELTFDFLEKSMTAVEAQWK